MSDTLQLFPVSSSLQLQIAAGVRGIQGETGATPNFTIGTVSTESPGDPATATITGTAASPVLNLGIPEGEQGGQGIQGETGDAATIAVGTVTTVAAGEPATVTNVGTSSAAIFDFGIPAGEDGEGTGDVSSSANITDHSVVRGDGGAKGVQDSGVLIDDSANLSGVNNVTGVDANFVTGTAGTSGNVAMWNADGDAVDSSVAAANILVDGDIGTTVQGYDADTLKADTDDNLTAGFTSTADNDGTQSSGTYTPDPAGGNLKRIVNGGAFTFAAPSASGDYTLIVQITNNASAGTITFSGFAVTPTGDSLTTTDGHDFFVFITKINGFISGVVQKLQ